MQKETILKFTSGIIAALFFYAAFSKLIDYDKSVLEMRNQIFPIAYADTLAWLVPLAEGIIAFLLLFQETRGKALWASLVLLSAFTLYIALVMTGIFGRIPCSCGGILKNMSYGTHLIFNLIFVAFALLGLAIDSGRIIYNRWFYPKKERSLPKN